MVTVRRMELPRDNDASHLQENKVRRVSQVICFLREGGIIGGSFRAEAAKSSMTIARQKTKRK